MAPVAPDIHLAPPTLPAVNGEFPRETPCFPISQVHLSGTEALPHWLPLARLANQAIGHCLGVQGINLLMSTLQNRLIDHGWVTTRVLAPQQDLTQGTLALAVVPGRIRQVRFTEDSDDYATRYSAMPAREGNVLDLRDIEQGLENLQRLPSVDATVALHPGNQPGESDIVITRKQKKMWRVNLWVDNTGTESAGKNQGGMMLALDNPLSLSDLFYVTATRDLLFTDAKASTNYSAHYSVPFGYWQLVFTGSKYDYVQTVALLNGDARYKGRSENINMQLSNVLYRNTSGKTTLNYGVDLRQTRNFIQETEIESQKRRTSSWRVGVTHRQYFASAILDVGGSYQRGTRWFGAIPAFEEYRARDGEDYATALSRILQLSASLTLPFSVSEQQFQLHSEYLRQLSATPLTPQDQFSIGNRWSVRGFDGERTLNSDDGWYLRNTLSWQTPLPQQQLYIGADYGRVDGHNRSELIGQTLAGGVIGLRGGYYPAGLSYDFSVGTPLSKPDGFKTDNAVVNFSVNWQY
ncbi:MULTISPECIES: ShlB/FhaC/HecB family hemolysin secretion/activation protein [Edwardsiella]|nr:MULTISPECIES: ShlB/FhaC/HecB family hemolysin secretion/activation protein [Edwardsiella]AKR77065.2 ShlB/FhaC/HecB family hemolysin secretion/activation protein [Edwardsiella sp. LADL05-105]UOU80858.1 ShlB/FhaC/HecB family hemolysin secretion/activation protein [Edwardsiella anguillarum]WHP85736.1 ShlB/FhaC/HecB family hemolysin secretion/activation protein [Edwardsiella anguillarum]WHP89522.1 ShlB/FhaC/HecB family hemolysin secretion/activation protein [Edwardsiella anguillarum]WHP93322.1 